MPQSLSQILIHVVFSTKHRARFLHPEFRDELYPYLATTARNHNCPTHKIGGTEDHVHIACSLSRTIAVADLVRELKTDSSAWLKTKGPSLESFAWQNGYGVFSIGQAQLDQLRQYIANQEEHHRRLSFQEEFRGWLKRYGIQYDERYVWRFLVNTN
jgi:REP element-mobilizing transposase RayT